MNPSSYVTAGKLNKIYDRAGQKIQVLKDINLQIAQGEFVAITGPSGSGKSSLLHIIGGLDFASSGSITIGGQDIMKLSDKQSAEFRNQQIGFVFQFFYLQPFLTMQQNISLPGIFSRSSANNPDRARQLAKLVGINERLDHLPKELSGGEMQRCAIAKALYNNPPLLLADEPTGNLDSQNSSLIIELFKKIRTQFNTTIIMVTHDKDLSAAADYSIALQDGKIDG